MDIFNLVLGAMIGFGGGVALWNGVRGGHGHSFFSRLLALFIGVASGTFGVIIFAQGLGLPWATFHLRSELFPWLMIPCLVLGVAFWFSQRRIGR